MLLLSLLLRLRGGDAGGDWRTGGGWVKTVLCSNGCVWDFGCFWFCFNCNCFLPFLALREGGGEVGKEGVRE